VSARVLEVLGYSGRGGAATSVVELARHLPAEGFEVTVAAPQHAAFAAAVEAAGARFVAAPMEGRGDWRSFARLVQLLRREPFDVVHTHCRNADLHGGLAARAVRATRTAPVPSGARPRGPVLVAHLRGLLVDGRGETSTRVVDRVHRAFLRHGPQRIVAISEAVRQSALAKLDVADERVVTVLNGVDCERYATALPNARADLRRQLSIPAAAPLALSLGTLGRCKGQDLVLQALPALPPDVHVLFVGESDAAERASLELLARRLGVAPRVRFLSPRDDVPELLAACDLLVHAARWEGFGRVVAEAMAAGRPVVASAVGGILELVQHGRTGLLVPPERADLLAHEMLRLLSDRPFAERLAEHARQHARERLDVRRTAREVADVLRDAAGLLRHEPSPFVGARS
jgi:glycosyltransferase involved in cell wall biosynthesis